MLDGNPKIRLEIGAYFQVPMGVDLQSVRHRSEQPKDTPVFQPYLTRVLIGGQHFQFPNRFTRRGFVLFMPEVKVGDELRLLWVDRKCACAVRAQDYERLMAGSRQELAPACG